MAYVVRRNTGAATLGLAFDTAGDRAAVGASRGVRVAQGALAAHWWAGQVL